MLTLLDANPVIELMTTGFLLGFAFYYGYLLAAYLSAKINRTIDDVLG